jgi:transposase
MPVFREAPAFRRGDHVTEIRRALDRDHFECVACGHTDCADHNAARNIHQASALAAEPPKRTLRRVGKRKQLRETVNVAS